MIDKISTVRLYMPPNLSDPRRRQQVFERALGAKQNFLGGFPIVSSIDMGLNNPDNLESKEEAKQCMKSSERIQSLKARILASPVNSWPVTKKQQYLEVFKRKKILQAEKMELKKKILQAEKMEYRTELKNRIRVLRRLGHITPNGVMQEKGKIAAEVEGVDE